MGLAPLAQGRFIHQIIEYHAQKQPARRCLVDDQNLIVTYGQLWQRIQLAVSYLRQQHIQAGDRVLIVGENGVDMVTLLFACSVLQAWPVSINARLSHREILTIAQHAQPKISFYTSVISSSALDHAQHDGADLIELPFLQDTKHICLHKTQHTKAHLIPPVDQVATLIYTSGTTGAPKGVMVPHKGLMHFARVSAQARHLTPEDCAYAALPLSHIFGIATVLLATLYAGGSLVLRSKFDAADVRRSLAELPLTILQGVPTMFNRMLAESEKNGEFKAPYLRYVYTGGAALDFSLKQRVEALFKKPLHHGYGITEYAGSLFLTRFTEPPLDCSAGYAVEALEIHIGDLKQAPLKPNEIGEIHVRGPGVMLGYYKDDQQTAEALLPGGWLKTGDLGYLTPEGALYITGRSKDLIIRSGFNVYPLEVEAVINAFPGVALSAAVGVPTEDGNEEVVVFCQPAIGQTIDYAQLRHYSKEQLAPYKRPSQFIEITALPTTVSGKIQKQPLREKAMGMKKKNEEII